MQLISPNEVATFVYKQLNSANKAAQYNSLKSAVTRWETFLGLSVFSRNPRNVHKAAQGKDDIYPRNWCVRVIIESISIDLVFTRDAHIYYDQHYV